MDQFLGLFSLKLELIYWKRCSLSKTSNLTPLAIYGGGVLPAIMLVSIFFIRNLCNCRCQKHWFWLIINSIHILQAQHFLCNLRTRKSLDIYLWRYIFECIFFCFLDWICEFSFLLELTKLSEEKCQVRVLGTTKQYSTEEKYLANENRNIA